MAPEPSKNDERPRAGRKAKDFTTTFALAMELPFVFAGAIVFGGLMGYFLDRWLHTKPTFMLLLGALGFVAGLRDVLRRLPGNAD